MKSAVGIIVIGVGCTLGMLSPALAQSGIKSQQEITKELCPGGCTAVPSILQSGEQGLPTPGAAPAAPPRPVVHASVSSSAAAPGRQQAAPQSHTMNAATAVAVGRDGCPAAQTAAAGSSSLSAITFEFDSAQLKPEAVTQLDALAKALKQDVPESAALIIEGHTDAAGSFNANEALSLARAQAVKDYLTQQQGVKQQLDVRGVGPCGLANPQEPRAAENRRVVIVNKAS
ncbi:MAG TPA: OmpA family protein [Stellaceae bacterium]|nr:OmpA family protein [Stellaceae bacterium]